ncbi:nitrate reductase molybdenum cofactor assembly chaperone [Orrella sp. NBD-18]|uniref:Nitrate reductase molybdenum cofactor assembly chaperone n=1 Tax=Sheuella amnicola TaxID=2707330 RepID=A0A6B2RAV3_9BURK|nr:nitrate reductase molybdenum cofactor assembly chaperone [Sheuella amnicola]NDY84405.1 nitrate reductase molybdenum cofactor assembly chaperone [Sheuella amnicola]HBI84109.1 nitrate reductase molybdenum cofactor assembly chaperone [Alcaligenaceae bacterium]
MQTFKILSALLCYPEQPMLDSLPEIRSIVQRDKQLSLELDSLLQYLESNPLIALQENYVATFDRNQKHSLHLFEHIHGESRDRGQAMVDLLTEYRNNGFLMVPDELPDYVPLFLEFLAHIPQEKSKQLLGDAIHVLAMIGEKLHANGSPYAVVFDSIVARCDVKPLPFEEPPVRDMDEALETFGPGEDGVEPLLKPSATQAIHFYPRRPAMPGGNGQSLKHS